MISTGHGNDARSAKGFEKRLPAALVLYFPESQVAIIDDQMTKGTEPNKLGEPLARMFSKSAKCKSVGCSESKIRKLGKRISPIEGSRNQTL